MKGLNVGLGLMQGHAEHHTKTRGETKSDYKVSQKRLLIKERRGGGGVYNVCIQLYNYT